MDNENLIKALVLGCPASLIELALNTLHTWSRVFLERVNGSWYQVTCEEDTYRNDGAEDFLCIELKAEDVFTSFDRKRHLKEEWGNVIALLDAEQVIKM